MVTIKKIALMVFAFGGILIANNPTDCVSGRIRISNIMSNSEMGISAYNKKNIHFAETQNIVKDLNIDQISDFFNCKTIIGKKFLSETLSCPVTPENKDSVLKKRQNAIKILVENPDLKKSVEELLEVARTEEQEVITLMDDFFIGRTCPELKLLESLRAQNSPFAPVIEFLNLNPIAKTVTTTMNFISLAYLSKYMGRCVKVNCQLARLGQYNTQLILSTAYLGLVTALIAYATHKDYSAAAEKRTKMHALNQLIQIAEKIENLCEISSIKPQFKLSGIKNLQGVQLIEKLKEARYRAKKSLLFMTPQVHTFLYEVYRQEKYLSELFACIAEMDSYNAIATKILESGNANNKFCFVEFTENPKSSLEAQGFWNVLVNDAIPNNISEGKHIILTGPNAGGKTTAIRALLQNIILAQSFGIAASETWHMTMFDVIHSYLNISDDISQGLSLFASEIKRAQDILQRIKSLEPNKKFFFALDELFTGTIAEDGEACAYQFVKKISEFEGVQFIYATHFEKLKELGNDGILCANYKVDAPIKNEDGKLVYPYTLSQGANESRVALDLAREANLFS